MTDVETELTRAKFEAHLLSEGPTLLLRRDVTQLLMAMSDVVAKASRFNIQSCKSWLLTHVFPSESRTKSFCQYLVALSTDSRHIPDRLKPQKQDWQLVRSLYLIHDCLHEFEYHAPNYPLAAARQRLLESAISLISEMCSPHKHALLPTMTSRVKTMLEIWAEHGLAGDVHVESMMTILRREAVDDRTEGVQTYDQSATGTILKAKAYSMPQVHGNLGSKYYDLPAATLFHTFSPAVSQGSSLEGAKLKPAIIHDTHVSMAIADSVRRALDTTELDYVSQNSPYNRMGRTGQLQGTNYYGWSEALCSRLKH